MNMIQLNSPEIQSLKQRAGSALAEADVLIIDSNEMYEIAAEHTKVIKLLAKTVEDQRKAFTKPLDESKKAAMDFFRPFSDACDKAESVLKRKMVDYDIAQKRKRMEEEQKALRAAEAKKRKEEERLISEAATAAETGDDETYQTLVAEAASVSATPTVAVAVYVEQPKTKGVSIKDNWVHEITDFAALVRAAAERPELIPLLQPNESAIRQMGKALKDAANVPGVRFFNDPIASVRK